MLQYGISAVDQSYTGLAYGTLGLGTPGINSTIAQRVLEDLGVVAACTTGFTVRFRGVFDVVLIYLASSIGRALRSKRRGWEFKSLAGCKTKRSECSSGRTPVCKIGALSAW